MKKKEKQIYNKEIIGIFVIAFSILSIVSLFSDRTGILGRVLKGFYFKFAGLGGYLLPLIVLSIGVLLVFNKIDEIKYKKVLPFIIIFACFLVIIDIYINDHLSFLDRIRWSINYGKEGLGGGIVGGVLGFIFLKLFGTIGSYTVLFFILLINFIVITKVDIGEFIKKKIRFSFSKPVVINDESKKVKPKRKVKKNKKSKKDIKILSHQTKKNKNDKKKRNTPIGKTSNNSGRYKIPSFDLLEDVPNKKDSNIKNEVLQNAKKIEDTMESFNIEAQVTQINRGPTVTCYELEPAPGVKVSRIKNLSNDISLNLAASDIRIEAPIPGKSVVGIEVPNRVKTTVSLKEMLMSDEYKEIDSKVPIALGKDISGKSIITNIDKMPHLLIAGATGSGKSVCINTIIMSILFKSTPDEVKMLLIDPKVVELNVYNGIPHLLAPIVTDVKKAKAALKWAVDEMEDRYQIFAKNNVRDIKSYNESVKNSKDKLPELVIIIDELSDLMMASAKEIEEYICRLAQMARAAGMYLIIATQRPSVDVITGTIKANIPSRISFSVTSQTDSRTILDTGGAEKLLGQGDMLFYPSSLPKPIRIQGAFVKGEEINRVVNFLKEQDFEPYEEEVIETLDKDIKMSDYDGDELLPDAIELVVKEGQASISLLQRRLRIGYARAARLIDEMEDKGIVGGFEGSKPRKVLIDKKDLQT